jgi:beta-lactamase regulating signal transducer with metallopeptidase domain
MAILEYDQYGNSVAQPSKIPTLGRIAGLILIVIGAGYICLVLSSAIRIIWNPNGLGPTLNGMAAALHLQDAAVMSGQAKIPIGHTVAFIALLLWYVLTSSIALKLIAVGNQLIAREKSDRMQMTGFMRDFAAAMRQQRI